MICNFLNLKIIFINSNDTTWILRGLVISHYLPIFLNLYRHINWNPMTSKTTFIVYKAHFPCKTQIVTILWSTCRKIDIFANKILTKPSFISKVRLFLDHSCTIFSSFKSQLVYYWKWPQVWKILGSHVCNCDRKRNGL